MKKQSLQGAIDRMVEASIRRILPSVMSEVLLKMVANGGVMQEQTRPATRIQKQVAPQQPGRLPKKQVRQQPQVSSLRELLEEDAGAEFYQDPREAMRQHAQQEESEYEEYEQHEEPEERPVARRLENLNPELRALAEDIDFDDDGGEMWDDASPATMGLVNEIKNPAAVAKSIGVDFARMAKTINLTAPAKKVDHQAAAARAQFEEQRLKRMREQLDGGKKSE